MKNNDYNKIPKWVLNIEKEDLKFIKEFILASGSLKDIAKLYDVSYPTVRIRLDKLIEKIKIADNDEDDTFIAFIKYLAIEEKIDIDIARLLIEVYRKEK